MIRSTHWMKGALCAALLTTAIVAAEAQEVTGSISGTVTDNSGAVVKGAMISLINTDRNEVVRTLTTNGSGFYTATSLPLGVYTVKVTDAGFKVDTLTGLVLHVDDKLTVNRQLIVGSTDQSVTVVADALHVNLEDAAVTGLINGTQTRELVLSTRNYEQLLSLQPGVAYTGATDQIYLGPTNPLGGANTVAFSVGGQRTSANNWTIDGADNVDRGSNLTLLSFPSVDAIAEFKTLRDTYSAEYGRSAAGQVNVSTRSGTNQVHGSAYEFFRNDVLQANNYFNNLNGVKRPPLRYNDFGYTVGGPVFVPKVYNGHNKTFFFYSQELRRVITYSPVTLYVPTAAERAGTFPVAVCANIVVAANGTQSCGTAAGTTQINTFSPLAAGYIKDIFANVPLPNPAPGADLHQLVQNGRNVYNDNQEFVRIDQAFGQKLNVFYRFLHDSIPTVEPFGYAGGTSFLGAQTTQTRSPGTQQLGHVTYVVGPKLLIDGGYAYSFGSIQSTPVGTATLANSPDIKANLPFTNTLGIVPNIAFSGFSGQTGISQSGIYNDFSRNHDVFGNVTKIFGNHTFIVGATYDRYQKTENATGGNAGNFTFTASNAQLPVATVKNSDSLFDQAFANFLVGNATGGFSQTPIAATPNLHANTIEAYVQDNWKVTPRLTLNLGVRYSYFAQPTDSSNLLNNFLPSAYNAALAPTIDSTGSICTVKVCANVNGLNSGTANPNFDPLNGLVYVNTALGHNSPYGNKVGQADTKNFGPRAGLAFDVFGDGKTSFRMGYGLAFDATLFGDYEINTFNNPPVTPSSYTYTSFDNPTAGTAAIPALPTLYSESEHFHTPYSQQYSANVQQQLSPSLTMEVGYVGSHDTHLIGYIDINSLPVGAAKAAGILPAGGITSATQTKILNQIRQFKGYGGMYGDDTIFSSNYNSLQIAVKKRFKGKSLIDGNYTWQRFLTNSPADRSGAPQDRFNIGQEYGRSVLDRTDYASIDFVYELPFLKEQKGLVGRLVGGWEVSAIVALDSGTPVTVAASAGGTINGATFADVGGLGIQGSSPAGFRPDQLFDPRTNAPKTRQQWFNTAAFASPNAAVGLPGNAKRGTIIGPGFNREDLGIFRNFRIFRESSFQLRGEAFNVLNHTNFSNPAVTATTASTFGTITSSREARILQIGGKITF